jgi:hypothetical protein
VPAALNLDKARKCISRNGKADLLVIRHIWEHTYDQKVFAQALRELVHKDAYMLFEVPDCSNLIDSLDFTMPWEEHLYYYTPYTLEHSLQQHGFQIIDIKVIPYLYEHSIVALVRAQNSNHEKVEIEKNKLAEAIQKGVKYANGYIPRCKMILEKLKVESKKKKIVLFGAGHSAGAFINHYSLKKYIEYIVDDNERKQGLFMPKSGIPIAPSQSLYKNYSTLCLLSVNPVHEEKIISKHREFVQKGGEFRSICPMSDYSLFSS